MVTSGTLHFLGCLESDGMLAGGTISSEDRCQAGPSLSVQGDGASTSGGVFGQVVSVLL